MFKRYISLVLSILTILSALIMIPTAASAAVADDISDTGAQADLSETGYSIPSETAFAACIERLKKKYPTYGYSGVYYEDGRSMAWQCYGYACQMLYEVFGIKYYADGFVNKAVYTMGTIYAGDIVRINGSHSIFITKVTSKGYYFTDANWDNANGVRWDAFYSKADLESIFTYKIHVPGNTLKGTAEALSGLYADMPKLKSAKCTAESINISWKAVDDASYYRVFYMSDTQKTWKAAGDTDKTVFKFSKNLTYKTNYTFTVRALDSYKTVISSYQKDGISVKYLVDAPQLQSAKSAVNIITVTWKAVDTVKKYRLYVKSGADTSWRRIANVTGTTYTYTKGAARTTYQFTVRCLNNAGDLISGCSVKTLSAKYLTYATQLSAPDHITAAATTGQGTLKVQWDAVKNAKRYAVFCKQEGVDKNWKRIAVTIKNYYVHTGRINNTVYHYTVRCVDTKGAFISDCRKGTTIHYYRIPEKLKAVKQNNNGAVKVNWNKVSGASSYALYYKTNNAKQWSRVKTEKSITANSYVFNGCKDGVKYTFTVRACDKSGKTISSYDPTGVSITYKAAVKATPDTVAVSASAPTEPFTELSTEPAPEDLVSAETVVAEIS